MKRTKGRFLSRKEPEAKEEKQDGWQDEHIWRTTDRDRLGPEKKKKDDQSGNKKEKGDNRGPIGRRQRRK